MTSKELSKLIREFVRAEIEAQKAQIIKEVKAEMFDLMISSNRPQLQTESVQSQTTTDMTREQLRNMFTQKMGADTFNFNTQNTPVSSPASLPQSFKGGPITEKHSEVMDAMNRTDYSALMKKMGI